MFPVCKNTIKNSQNKKKLEKYVRRLVLGTDLHHFLVQSRRPAFGTALYPLRRGEGDFRHFKSFEQVEQVDE